MIKTMRFFNFKGLEDFRISLEHNNILTGVNNAGKSTVLDGLRVLAGAIRVTRSRIAGRVPRYGNFDLGFRIPDTLIPISTRNLFTDYKETPAEIMYTLTNGRSLRCVFMSAAECYLYPDASAFEIQTVNKFQRAYPISITIVPTLGPFEEEEKYLSDDYFERVWQTRSSHRYFRNFWVRQTEVKFAALREMIVETWPTMYLTSVDLHYGAPTNVFMYCEERISGHRRLREIFWAGFGFQIWLQFLSHLVIASQNTLLVIDEPDIYLHPELQRRLFHLLQRRSGPFVLATHSSEIINEADQNDIIIVDRSKKHARRVRDIDDLQNVFDRLGSKQNIHLMKLSNAKRVLFLEGDDFFIFKRFAAKLNLQNIVSGDKLAVVSLGGFSNSSRIQDVAWAFEKVLRADIKLAVVLDKDYRRDEEARQICESLGSYAEPAVILKRKEIENYLLSPHGITAAVNARLRTREQDDQSLVNVATVESLLDDIYSDLKMVTRANTDACRLRFLQKSGKSPETILREGGIEFESAWDGHPGREFLVPGKEAFARLNERIQKEYRVNITVAGVINSMRQGDICASMKETLDQIEAFCSRE